MVKTIKVRDAIRAVEADGWAMIRRTGTNHRQYKHPTKPGRVTITGNPGKDMDIKDVMSVERQAGIELR